jgi:hypothetical protein
MNADNMRLNELPGLSAAGLAIYRSADSLVAGSSQEIRAPGQGLV